MKRQRSEEGKRLWIQVGGLFDCPYEWTIVDFVYWKSNTQTDRRWTCRMSPIQKTTPVKRIETITKVLDRLCERGMGFSKIPFGKPQRRRCGTGLTAEPQQSYQYVFDGKVFDAWLRETPPIRKRIDRYPKADSQLSENGQQTYPKADTTRREEEVQKKEIKEPVWSQPPSTLAAVAPKQMTGDEMAEKFESLFRSDFHQGSQSASNPEGIKEGNQENGSQPPSPSVAPSTGDHAASGGVEVGVVSTPVALPSSDSTTIQDDYGQPEAGGQNKPDTFLARVSAPIIPPSASGTTNTRAPNKTTRRSGRSARVASGGVAFGLTDAERQELASKHGYTKDDLARLESVIVLEQIYGPRKAKSRHGRDS